MIASVVAILSDDAGRLSATIGTIKSSPQMEVGEFTDKSRRIPITIDSPDNNAMEVVTRWLQDRPGVLFVDVVFVHFENSATVPHDVADTPFQDNRKSI